MHWRRKWQPTLVFLPGESQGWGILVGCHLWGRTESDMTEVTQQHDGEKDKHFFQSLPVRYFFKLQMQSVDCSFDQQTYIQVILKQRRIPH